MVLLWGSKNDDREGSEGDNQAPEGHGAQSSERLPRQESRAPDERTRLLSRSREGYLSPDDPAVRRNLYSKYQNERFCGLS
jgi:hypothetical protein